MGRPSSGGAVPANEGARCHAGGHTRRERGVNTQMLAHYRASSRAAVGGSILGVSRSGGSRAAVGAVSCFAGSMYNPDSMR